MKDKINVLLRIPKELSDAVDSIKGDVPRHRWIIRAIEAHLLNAKKE